MLTGNVPLATIPASGPPAGGYLTVSDQLASRRFFAVNQAEEEKASEKRSAMLKVIAVGGAILGTIWLLSGKGQ